jgi:nitrile hydratase accessory protein
MRSTSICGTTILSQPDAVQETATLAALPRLRHDDGGPVFAEPWQAQAFALAVTLSGQGHFTWKEWAGELADTLRAAADRGEPDDGSRYYVHWLATLERLVIAKGLANQAALVARKDAWTAAYLNTPHGNPVELRRSLPKPDARWILPALLSAVVVYGITRYADLASLKQLAAMPRIGLLATAAFGSLLGIRHALEPDHLAAVSTLMTGERSSAKAAWLGACWGLGHTLTLVAAGALMVLFRADMPPLASDVFELAVVALLVGFGGRAIYRALRGTPTNPTHSHAKRSPSTSAPDRRWSVARRPLVVGAVHGLAGSGAITALVVTTLPSTMMRIAYLALFGIGSIIGMAALSGLLGWPLARFGGHRATARTLSLGVGSVSTALGLMWGYPLIERFF